MFEFLVCFYSFVLLCFRFCGFWFCFILGFVIFVLFLGFVLFCFVFGKGVVIFVSFCFILFYFFACLILMGKMLLLDIIVFIRPPFGRPDGLPTIHLLLSLC